MLFGWLLDTTFYGDYKAVLCVFFGCLFCEGNSNLLN